jgi:hypothetical protein
MTQEIVKSGVWEQELRVPLHTFARVYARLLAGEDVWLPLGNMMHQFFGMYRERRAELVADPIGVPEDVSAEHWRWAVFCAASVDYLCRISGLPCPLWAQEERYQLADPWFLGIGSHLPARQERLRQITPTEFARRNVFCGDRVYWNKYEHARKTA